MTSMFHIGICGAITDYDKTRLLLRMGREEVKVGRKYKAQLDEWWEVARGAKIRTAPAPPL